MNKKLLLPLSLFVLFLIFPQSTFAMSCSESFTTIYLECTAENCSGFKIVETPVQSIVKTFGICPETLPTIIDLTNDEGLFLHNHLLNQGTVNNQSGTWIITLLDEYSGKDVQTIVSDNSDFQEVSRMNESLQSIKNKEEIKVRKQRLAYARANTLTWTITIGVGFIAPVLISWLIVFFYDLRSFWVFAVIIFQLIFVYFVRWLQVFLGAPPLFFMVIFAAIALETSFVWRRFSERYLSY